MKGTKYLWGRGLRPILAELVTLNLSFQHEDQLLTMMSDPSEISHPTLSDKSDSAQVLLPMQWQQAVYFKRYRLG
jgi:hypothetical protein